MRETEHVRAKYSPVTSQTCGSVKKHDFQLPDIVYSKYRRTDLGMIHNGDRRRRHIPNHGERLLDT